MKIIATIDGNGVLLTEAPPLAPEIEKARATVARMRKNLAAKEVALAGSTDPDEQDDLRLEISALAQGISMIEPQSDDAYVQAVAAQLFGAGGWVVVDWDDLPKDGEPHADWTISDGKVVRK